jgi:hypothetical protein
MSEDSDPVLLTQNDVVEMSCYLDTTCGGLVDQLHPAVLTASWKM